MPIGVLAGKAEYMDALDGGMWQFGDDSYPSVGVTFFAGTFVRHPLTMAAAKAVLHYLKEQGPELQEDLNKRTTALVAQLNEILTRYGVPTQIESFGSVFYFSFPAGFRFGSLFYYHLREKGVHVLEGFPCFLTTAHTDADLGRIVRAFEETAQAMRAGGVLPVAEEEVPLVEAATSRDSFAEAPMTEPQREIFLAATMGDDASCSFNESFSLHFRGPLEIDALRQSIRHVVNRHDALRSIIDPDGTKLHFHGDLALDVGLRDLTPLEKTAREGEFRRILEEDARRPFDLVKGPLLRAELIRFEPDYHILLFTSHHIVCDGWSTNILLEELSASYTARRTGQAAQLDSPVSFASYAERQFESRSSPEHSDTEAYWLGQFKDIPAPLDLPLDRPRQMVRTYRGATYRAHVGAETYSRAKQIGSKLGCTPFVTLLTAFAALLYGLSKQEDIVIGIPTAGQSLLDDGNLVGHCVNFLPLRTRFRDDLPLSELLQSVGKTLLDAQDHQSYTYGTLVRKLAIQRDPSRLPLIEVQFNLERIGGKLEFEGVEASVDPNPKRAVNFDIFFNVVEGDCGLTIDCDYNTDLFDEATISRWMGHYETLLEGIARNVQQPVSELPLLSDRERRQLLVGWNATAADYPRSQCVHQLIEEQVGRAPENVALKFRDEVLTYAELAGRSSQLANYLRNLGVGPGNLVGIATERTSDILVAVLATWKTGAAYVPLDPAYPRERLASILDQTKASVLLTHSPLRAQLPRCDGRLICLDKDKELIERESQAAPKLTYDSGSTAYVIFTSGSTGTPKGVEVTHRGVVNLLCSMRAKPGFTENDRLLAVTTLSFDIAALELVLPLICGGTVLLADRETAADGRLIEDEIFRLEPTVMQATPATWRLLLEAGWNGTPRMKILCGGEAPARSLADRLVECGEVWNMYGPTETTIWSAACRLEKGSGPVTFGEPIANTQFYVLDSRKNPVPIGVPGELYIGGEGVARGYFHQPDLTAQRFVRDPFASQVTRATSPRMFKTGDLVRYRPDGRIEFLGRLDHQVKVRGFRIELEEIEAALAKHPAIRECVVTANEHEPGTSKLVAYFIANDSERPSVGELRDWLAASLPAYAVPSLFVPLAAFPKTPNGKTDRKALPAPDGVNAAASRSFVVPRTRPERELARICAEVLDLEQVSIDDSLFHLGADSIHVFQIVARANRAGIAISPQHVLKLQTIRALASALDANGNGHAQSDSATIPRVAREQYRLEPTPRSP
jgi:amino acid adenylation domain-containing protein